MTLNNRTFTLLKIVLLIIISIFIAEIIVLPKIEHDMLQEAGRQELVTVQQICGAVLENYPDVEQDFILGLRQPTNSLQEKGEQILKQYGYDEEHLLADNTLYAAYMIAWRNWTGFFLVTTFLLLAAALLYFYSTIRSSNKEILLILEQYLSEDFSFAYGTERIVKGRIHFMSNQIGDRLKQLGHQIVTKNTRITEEKESTKALVTDISHQLKTPMAALKTCFYMYLDASDADEKTEFLKRSETQLEKLEQLIASLMNISRLETAMISLTKESILLSDLLVDAVNGVYEKARRKSIEISVQETENITLHLDKHWTSEAVINVLDNAVKYSVADGLFCREIDGLFCRSSPDIIVRRRCVLSHKRRGWLQPSPSFRYSRNLALQDELYHPVINNGPAVLVCVDKRLGTGPVNQSRDAG